MKKHDKVANFFYNKILPESKRITCSKKNNLLYYEFISFNNFNERLLKRKMALEF